MSKHYAYRTSFTFDGKRYVVYAESETELIEKKTNKLRDLQEGKVTIGENMPLKKWAEMALDTYKAGRNISIQQSVPCRSDPCALCTARRS